MINTTEMRLLQGLDNWLITRNKMTREHYIREYPIHHAASNGNTLELKRLIETMSYNVNHLDLNGNTPLMVAIEKGKIDCVKYLLKNNAKINIINYAGNDAILIACVENRVEILKYLIDNRSFDFDRLYDDNKTILHYIAEIGDHCTLGIVANKMKNLDNVDFTGASALMISAAEGHIKQVKDLIDLESNVNLQNSIDGRTALFYACENGHYEVVEILLKHKADPYIGNENAEIPFMIACHNKHVDIARLLILCSGGPK